MTPFWLAMDGMDHHHDHHRTHTPLPLISVVHLIIVVRERDILGEGVRRPWWLSRIVVPSQTGIITRHDILYCINFIPKCFTIFGKDPAKYFSTSSTIYLDTDHK